MFLQTTLQQSQTASLLSLLNLNAPTVPGVETTGLATNGPPVWKVLILDQRSKDVLATVLRVQDLRDVGVTLHVYVEYSLCGLLKRF